MLNYGEMLDFEINFWVSEVTGKTADYCNSWADAGPVIQQASIAVCCFKNSLADAFPTAEGLMSNKFVSHPNPLRAAMIVFLMMKEKAIG